MILNVLEAAALVVGLVIVCASATWAIWGNH